MLTLFLLLEETVSLQTFWYSGSYNLSTPLLWCPLSQGGRSWYVEVFLGAGLPWVCGSLHCVQLGFSVNVFICCKERIL